MINSGIKEFADGLSNKILAKEFPWIRTVFMEGIVLGIAYGRLVFYEGIIHDGTILNAYLEENLVIEGGILDNCNISSKKIVDCIIRGKTHVHKTAKIAECDWEASTDSIFEGTYNGAQDTIPQLIKDTTTSLAVTPTITPIPTPEPKEKDKEKEEKPTPQYPLLTSADGYIKIEGYGEEKKTGYLSATGITQEKDKATRIKSPIPAMPIVSLYSPTPYTAFVKIVGFTREVTEAEKRFIGWYWGEKGYTKDIKEAVNLRPAPLLSDGGSTAPPSGGRGIQAFKEFSNSLAGLPGVKKRLHLLGGRLDRISFINIADDSNYQIGEEAVYLQYNFNGGRLESQQFSVTPPGIPNKITYTYTASGIIEDIIPSSV